MVTRKKATLSDLIPTKDQDVLFESLREFGKRNMTIYAAAVNLDRSVPDLFDGLKTVQRRVLYGTFKEASSQFEKTARVVGTVLGRYHPHGDLSVVKAIETMVHTATPVVTGEGNWGNMIDGCAAMRYTDLRLSQFGKTFFDPDYINSQVTSFIPNYDDKDVEPVTLPAQLPNVLMNGNSGIGVGITTTLPSFTPESIQTVLKKMLQGEKLEAADFAKTLKYAHKWGGQLVRTKENQQAWLNLFQGTAASVLFESDIEVDRDHKQMVISDWPQGTDLEKFVSKIRAMPECLSCQNSKGSITYTIKCKPAYNYNQFDKFLDKVKRATRQKRSFKLNVTLRESRTVDGVTTFETKFLAMSVPEILVTWLHLRLDLERRSLECRIEKQNVAIAYSELLLYACDKLDAIFKALRSTDPESTMMRLLKITRDQSQQILELKVRQLSKLDQSEIRQKLKDQQMHLRQLQAWLKKPRSKVALDIDKTLECIQRDRDVVTKRETRKLQVV